MKKIILFLMLLLLPIGVKADRIFNIDMKIDILKDGTANITETWKVKATSGSEWYKKMYDLGNSGISDFKVAMDGNALTYKEWDVDEDINEKSGYYGINNTSDGLELCFGKSDYGNHTFVLNYSLNNYIFNTSDSQVLYWTLMPKITLDNFTVEVSSYYNFPSTLDVWGYGYKGYAYVQDSKIKMSNDGSLNDDYIVLLAKFPLDTFDTTNSYLQFPDFNSVLTVAEEGTFEYDYGTEITFLDKLLGVISTLIPILFTFIFGYIGIKAYKHSLYGYIDNKVINKNNTPMFRDIPCNKDIYYANALIKLNRFGYNETNILGAIILKWVKYDKIRFINQATGIFNKNTSMIDLTMNPTFDNENEAKLFDMMYKASKDGILESKEFEKWCKNNYDKFLDFFSSITNDVIGDLKSSNHIRKKLSGEKYSFGNIMSDSIYEDSKALYGLKLFLEEFSLIDTKEVMEVKLWDEYLMFAYLFGIADKVAKQLKNLYPEVLEQANFDYDTVIFVNHISTRSVSAATSARSAAQSYSGGGGGFSSGGGGGGSFGGGGSAGGR